MLFILGLGELAKRYNAVIHLGLVTLDIPLLESDRNYIPRTVCFDATLTEIYVPLSPIPEHKQLKRYSEKMSFATSTWEGICARYPPGWIEGVGSAAVQFFGFILPGLGFLAFDILKPASFASRKIQQPCKQPSKQQMLSCLGLVFGNQLFLIASHFFLLRISNYELTPFRMDSQLPSILEVVINCAVGAILRDVVFYYVHRLMHTKILYRRIHRIHHEFRAPIALAAIYSHTIDHVLVNAMPIYISMAVQRVHFLTLMLFASVAVFDAAVSHSGYSLFRLPSVENHDIHHEKGNINFGILGVMDWLHGTHAIQYNLL
ncbi:sterol-4-alpha methyl oxidase [Coccidioides immitis H538.4]|nr:sterol-4-alpha methyl oxidase [Coccidioides immitis RMSCC 2394]KMU86338.1 sterol-4-alpha methyl oxidase [Coccidioides immitis H538.4]